MPQWPNIELMSVPTNSEPITNNMSQNKPLIDNATELTNGDLTKYQKRMAAIVDNIYYSYGRGKNAVNALNGISIKVPEGNM